MEKTIRRELKVKLGEMARRRLAGYREAETIGAISSLSMYAFEYIDCIEAGIKTGIYAEATWKLPCGTR